MQSLKRGERSLLLESLQEFWEIVISRNDFYIFRGKKVLNNSLRSFERILHETIEVFLLFKTIFGTLRIALQN